MFAWAADPQRGNCLPTGFLNPFHRRVIGRRREVAPDMTGEPDVTVAMAAELLDACDDWQLRIFAPLVFLGLRPGELIFLFREMVSQQFLDVRCVPELAHLSKGMRNKKLPLAGPIRHLLLDHQLAPARGLLFCGREIASERPPLAGATLAQIAAEFERRCRDRKAKGASAVQQMRDEVMHDAGALTYKLIQGEFAGLARKLGWPAAATIKDIRHQFNTALSNGGVPEHERRYLMGHEPGRGAIVHYTHLNKLSEHYQRAVEQELAPALDVLVRRQQDVGRR
jgi:integrase